MTTFNLGILGVRKRVVDNLLLVDPVVTSRGVLVEALGEPESNLLLSVLDSVGTVADVSANVQSVGTPDRTGLRLEGVSGTEHDTAGPMN